MKYFYDVLNTVFDTYGVHADFTDLVNAAKLFGIEPQVKKGEDISDSKITERQFDILVEYLGEKF